MNGVCKVLVYANIAPPDATRIRVGGLPGLCTMNHAHQKTAFTIVVKLDEIG